MTDELDRLITLGVGTKGNDDYRQTFEKIAELGIKLGETHGYVNLSANMIPGNAEIEEDEPVYHDENTIYRVREAIMNIGLNSQTTEMILKSLDKAGIVFRERISS